MIKVSSKVRLNMTVINKLSDAAVTTLEQTAEALHTEVVQAEVMPRDTGTLQNESTFVDVSKSLYGKASIISSTPYARRLYFHPEYKFQKWENAFAMGKWYGPWLEGGIYDEFTQETFARIYRRMADL